jgi:thiamine-phosphate pyrophosphorylase
MVALADQVAACCRQSGARFIVNDRVDVALMTGADGVHVGQTDVPPRRARAMMPPPGWIGYSTHSLAQIELGTHEPVDYLAFGPVFPTASKLDPAPFVGLDGLARAAARASDAALPLVAIGGITLDRVPEVVASGASAVAVISDLLTGECGSRARRFLDVLEMTESRLKL